MYRSQEEALTDIGQSFADESGGPFRTGDKMITALMSGIGFTEKELIQATGLMTGKGRSTVYKRLRVALVFDEDHRFEFVPGGYWEHYAIAATAADTRDPSSYPQAWKWIERSIDSGWTTRELGNQIDPKADPDDKAFLLNATPLALREAKLLDQEDRIRIAFEGDAVTLAAFVGLPDGAEVTLTASVLQELLDAMQERVHSE